MGEGSNSVCVQAGEGGGKLPKSIFCLLKTSVKIRRLEAPSSRDKTRRHIRIGMSEGPKPSSSVKGIRPRLTKTNVSAV